jgi:glycosyltransferase involved in cell wall biosynthesis
MSRRFYVTLEKVAARCSDRILSQNAEDIRTAVRERICPEARIAHLGNGIDLSVFDPDRFDPTATRRRRQELGIPEGAPVVGFVGRLAARRKGFLDFLKATAEVTKRVPEVRFVVVGDADRGKPDAVEPEAAREYGIWERCHFLGQRENSELPGLYALMNVLVLPSLFEGIPRVIMEASAMGVPAVATDVKGNREAVEPGRNGLLVPLGDVPALAGAIVQLLTNPAQAQEMGEEGRRVALERFDERCVFARVKAEYAELLQRKGLALPRQGRAAAGVLSRDPDRSEGR